MAGSQDMSGIKPVYQYQNEETGQIGFVDAWQVENGFFENNPRLHKVGTCYSNEAYEALQKENKRLQWEKDNVQRLGLKANEALKAENEALRKQVEELTTIKNAALQMLNSSDANPY